jgi:hypothetical protein
MWVKRLGLSRPSLTGKFRAENPSRTWSNAKQAEMTIKLLLPQICGATCLHCTMCAVLLGPFFFGALSLSKLLVKMLCFLRMRQSFRRASFVARCSRSTARRNDSGTIAVGFITEGFGPPNQHPIMAKSRVFILDVIGAVIQSLALKS